MFFTTLITLLLYSIALAAPTYSAPAPELCAPSLYTISNFDLTTSLNAARVDFGVIATFPNTTGVEDLVMFGVDCHAEGQAIPNNNVCNTPNRNLLFDLRGPEETAHYQITHTWKCNGQEWMSGNDVTVAPLLCHIINGERMCTFEELNFQPQNVRKVAGGPPKA